MGMRDWLEKQQKKIEDKLKQDADPATQKEAKKKAAKKTAERVMKVINLAKKGVDAANGVSKKAGKITDAAAEKAIELAEKAKPVADRVDGAAEALGKKIKGVFNGAKDKAVEKAEEVKKDIAAQPTSGSRIFDGLMPAVPEMPDTKKT